MPSLSPAARRWPFLVAGIAAATVIGLSVGALADSSSVVTADAGAFAQSRSQGVFHSTPKTPIANAAAPSAASAETPGGTVSVADVTAALAGLRDETALVAAPLALEETETAAAVGIVSSELSPEDDLLATLAAAPDDTVVTDPVDPDEGQQPAGSPAAIDTQRTATPTPTPTARPSDGPPAEPTTSAPVTAELSSLFTGGRSTLSDHSSRHASRHGAGGRQAPSAVALASDTTEPTTTASATPVPTAPATPVATELTVPRDSDAGVTLTQSTGAAINIGLPYSDAAGDATRLADGTVAYPSSSASANAVVPTAGGVQLLTTIADASAPTRYPYRLQPPAGGRVELAGAGATILGADGEVLNVILPAWAKDASGREIPSHFELDGATLVQVVEHTSVADVAYPVVADPWFLSGLFSAIGSVVKTIIGHTFIGGIVGGCLSGGLSGASGGARGFFLGCLKGGVIGAVKAVNPYLGSCVGEAIGGGNILAGCARGVVLGAVNEHTKGLVGGGYTGGIAGAFTQAATKDALTQQKSCRSVYVRYRWIRRC